MRKAIPTRWIEQAESRQVLTIILSERDPTPSPEKVARTYRPTAPEAREADHTWVILIWKLDVVRRASGLSVQIAMASPCRR